MRSPDDLVWGVLAGAGKNPAAVRTCRLSIASAWKTATAWVTAAHVTDIPAGAMRVRWRLRAEETGIDVDALVAAAAPGPSGPEGARVVARASTDPGHDRPTANFFSQPQLEAVLAEAAESQATVTVRRGCEVVGRGLAPVAIIRASRAAAASGSRTQMT
ncbi:hypothetical protein AB0M42_31305 [Streptomyces sp. NPDC051784]|uniref:hypothetical protein n=1 Tax=Streptomyces sp. NPDC051784 TaxID=3155805 RepID=UPI003417A9B8